MPDLYIFTRNQENVAMSSIEGELFTVLLFQNQILLHAQPVDLFLAEVLFFDLPIGTYNVLVAQPQVNPIEVRQKVQLDIQTAVMGLRFIYSELERQLLRVEVRQYTLDG